MDPDTMDKRRDLIETGLSFYFFLLLAIKYIRETFWISRDITGWVLEIGLSQEYEAKYS